MNKNQFINKHANLSISQAELNRKWEVQLREQQDLEYQRMVYEAIQQSVNSTPSGLAGGGGGSVTAPAVNTQFLLGKYIDGYAAPFSNLVRLKTDGSLDNFNGPVASLSILAFTTSAISPLTYFTSGGAEEPADFRFHAWNQETGDITTLAQSSGPVIPPYGSMSLHYRASTNTFLYLANWYYGEQAQQIGLYEINVLGTTYEVTGLAEYESPSGSNNFSPVSVMDIGHVLAGGAVTEFLPPLPAGQGPYTPGQYDLTPYMVSGNGEQAVFRITVASNGYIEDLYVLQLGFGYVTGDEWTIYGNLLGGNAGQNDVFGTITTTIDVPCLTAVYQRTSVELEFDVTQATMFELSPFVDYAPIQTTWEQLEIINHPWGSAKIKWVIGTTQDVNGDIFFNLYCEKLNPLENWPDNQIGDVFCVAKLNGGSGFQTTAHQLEFLYEYQWDSLTNTIYLGLSTTTL